MTASPIELTPSLTREVIYQLALDSGLLDSSLSSVENWMTDYGSSEDSVWAFAQAVGQQCYEAGMQAERARNSIASQSGSAGGPGAAYSDNGGCGAGAEPVRGYPGAAIRKG